jgi:GNAT superfamily N-acetyltransferase
LAITIEALGPGASPQDIEHARALLLEYGRFVTEAEGAAHFCFGKLQDEVDGLPDTYRKQDGDMLVAYSDGEAAGCVTCRGIANISRGCEMKRLWVRPAFRGTGLGERLVVAAIELAAARFNAMYLDTFPATMKSAFEMYLRLGFTPCDPYNDSTFEGVVFMRRPLP